MRPLQHQLSLVAVLVMLAVSSVVHTAAALSLQGVTCGTRRCSLSESCSQYSGLCEPCQHICEQDSHNHEAARCERDCQAYLLDQRYVPRSEFDVRDELIRLRSQQRATLAACCVLAALLLLIAVWRCLRVVRTKGWLTKEWIRDKLDKHADKSSKTPDVPTIMQNPHTVSPASTRRPANHGSGSDLKLKIPSSTYDASTVATLPVGMPDQYRPSTVASGWSTPHTEVSNLATPSSTRHPAEDASLVINNSQLPGYQVNQYRSSDYQTNSTSHTDDDVRGMRRIDIGNGGGGGGGYDNKGLNLTPSPGKTDAKHESAF